MNSKRTAVGKKPSPGLSGALYSRVCQVLESSRENAARSVNTAQVVANSMVGREIVEEDQQGEERAGYAERVIEILSERLSTRYGRGYSSQNLAYMKQFYVVYPALLQEPPIFHALRGKSSRPEGTGQKFTRTSPPEGQETPENQAPNIFHALRGKLQSWHPGQLHPGLSWTHYRTLLRVDRKPARAFYEIEATRNAWSARKLERQIDSLLFERLAKSRDKKGLMKLASEGQSVSMPMDIFKDPMVIEFSECPNRRALSNPHWNRPLSIICKHFCWNWGKALLLFRARNASRSTATTSTLAWSSITRF
jgi:hypothetical protein